MFKPTFLLLKFMGSFPVFSRAPPPGAGRWPLRVGAVDGHMDADIIGKW